MTRRARWVVDAHCALCWDPVYPADRLCRTCRVCVLNALLTLLAALTVGSWWAYFAAH